MAQLLFFEAVPTVVQAGISVSNLIITGQGFSGSGVNLLVFTSPDNSVAVSAADFTIDNDQQITIPLILFPTIGNYKLEGFSPFYSPGVPIDTLDGAVVANAASIDFNVTPNEAIQNEVTTGIRIVLTGVPSNQVRRVKFSGPSLLTLDAFQRPDTVTILLNPLSFPVVGKYHLSLYGDTAETQPLGQAKNNIFEVLPADTLRMVIDGLTKTSLQPDEVGTGIQVKGRNFTIDTITHIKIQDVENEIFTPQPAPFNPDTQPPAGQFRVLGATRVLLGPFALTTPGVYGIMFEKHEQVNRGNVVSSATLTVGPDTQLSFPLVSGFSAAAARTGDILEFNDPGFGGALRRFTITVVLNNDRVRVASLNPDGLGNVTGGSKNNIRVFLDNNLFLASQPFVLSVRDTRKPAIVFNPPAQDFGGSITLEIRAETTDPNTGLPTGTLDPASKIYFTVDGTTPKTLPSYLYPPKDQNGADIPLVLVRPTVVKAYAIDSAGNKSDLRVGFFNIGGLIDRLPVGFENLFDNFIRAARTNDAVKLIRLRYQALLDFQEVAGVKQVSPGWSARKSNLLRDMRRGVVDILQEAGLSLGEALAPPIIEFVNEARLRLKPGREIFTPSARLNRASPVASATVTVSGSNLSIAGGFSTAGVVQGDMLELKDPNFAGLLRHFHITAIVNGNTVTVFTLNPDLFGAITTGTKTDIVAFRPPREGTPFPGNLGDTHHYVLRRADENIFFTTPPADGTYGVYLSPSLVGHSYLDRFITLVSNPPSRAILRLAGTFTVTAGKIDAGSISNITDPGQRPSLSNWTDPDVEPGDRIPVKDIHWRETEIAAYNAELPTEVPVASGDDGSRANDPAVLPSAADDEERPRQFMPPSNLSDPLLPDTQAQLAGSIADTPRTVKSVNKTVRVTLRGRGYGPIPVQIPINGSVRINGKVAGGCVVQIDIAAQTVTVFGNGVANAFAGTQFISGLPGFPGASSLTCSGAPGAVFSGAGLQSYEAGGNVFSLINVSPPGGFGWSTTKRLSQAGQAGPAHGGVHCVAFGTGGVKDDSIVSFNGSGFVKFVSGPPDTAKVLAMSGASIFGGVATGTLPPYSYSVEGGGVAYINLADPGVIINVSGGATLTSRGATVLQFTMPSPAGSGKNETKVFPHGHGTALKTERVDNFTLHDFSCTISGNFTAQAMKQGTVAVPATMTHSASPITNYSYFPVPVTPFQKDGFWSIDIGSADAAAFEVAFINLSENAGEQAQGAVYSGGAITLKMRPKGIEAGDVTDILFSVAVNGKIAIGPV